MREFRPAKKRADVSVGESVRILRELQGLCQNQLAELSGIAQAALWAIENDRVRLGGERGKTLAGALGCHPAVLLFRAGKCRLKVRPNRAFERTPIGVAPKRGGSQGAAQLICQAARVTSRSTNGGLSTK